MTYNINGHHRFKKKENVPLKVAILMPTQLRGWGPDSGRWGRFMKAVKLLSDPTKTKIYKRPAL